MKPPPLAAPIRGLCAIWTPLCLVISAVIAPLGMVIAPKSIPPLQLTSGQPVSVAVQFSRLSWYPMPFQTLETVQKVSTLSVQGFNGLRPPDILIGQDTPPDRGSPGRSQGAGSRYRSQPPPTVVILPGSLFG